MTKTFNGINFLKITIIALLLSGCTKAKEYVPDFVNELTAPTIDISRLGLDDLDLSVSEPTGFGQVGNHKSISIKLKNNNEESLSVSFDSPLNNFSYFLIVADQ